MRVRVFTKMFLSLFLLCGTSPALAFDFSGWDSLLKKYVAPKTIDGVPLNAVDYKNLAKDPEYKKLVNELEATSLSNLKTPKDKLVFWINTYNVMAAKMVLDHYPVKSIKDAGSFFTGVWKKEVGTVAGKIRTLDEIEHKILRKMGEPRIHVAIVCASVSCPDLRPEAYTAENIDRQLDEQVASFLANSQKGLRLDEGKKKLYLSSIFDWFEEDFEAKGGVVNFLAPYAPESIREKMKSKSLKIKYLDYNWGLNE